jgi:hypothetical protein
MVIEDACIELGCKDVFAASGLFLRRWPSAIPYKRFPAPRFHNFRKRIENLKLVIPVSFVRRSRQRPAHESRGGQTKKNHTTMHTAALIEMKVIDNLALFVASLPKRCFRRNRKPKPDPRVVCLNRSRPLLRPGSIITLHSPGDQLQVVALRLNEYKASQENIKNE